MYSLRQISDKYGIDYRTAQRKLARAKDLHGELGTIEGKQKLYTNEEVILIMGEPEPSRESVALALPVIEGEIVPVGPQVIDVDRAQLQAFLAIAEDFGNRLEQATLDDLATSQQAKADLAAVLSVKADLEKKRMRAEMAQMIREVTTPTDNAQLTEAVESIKAMMPPKS